MYFYLLETATVELVVAVVSNKELQSSPQNMSTLATRTELW